MSRKHTRAEPIVVDKHVAGDVVVPLLGRRAINATTARPARRYRGKHADDEDYAHVLQLGWENEVAVVTADGEMIAKAQQFERQFGKAESCLRGVIILPPGKEIQAEVVRRFVAGELVPIATRKGDAPGSSLDEIEDYNLGIDLRQKTPRVVHLCDCVE